MHLACCTWSSESEYFCNQSQSERIMSVDPPVSLKLDGEGSELISNHFNVFQHGLGDSQNAAFLICFPEISPCLQCLHKIGPSRLIIGGSYEVMKSPPWCWKQEVLQVTSLGKNTSVCCVWKLFGIRGGKCWSQLVCRAIIWVTCNISSSKILFKSLQWFIDFLKDRGTELPLGRRLGDRLLALMNGELLWGAVWYRPGQERPGPGIPISQSLRWCVDTCKFPLVKAKHNHRSHRNHHNLAKPRPFAWSSTYLSQVLLSDLRKWNINSLNCHELRVWWLDHCYVTSLSLYISISMYIYI